MGRRSLLERALEPVDAPLDAVEAPLDAAPARGDQVDEERKVLDTGPPLGPDVSLQPLETADRLPRKTSYLGQVSRDREHFGAERLLERSRDAVGKGRLELGGGLGQHLELLPRPLERRVAGRPVR